MARVAVATSLAAGLLAALAPAGSAAAVSAPRAARPRALSSPGAGVLTGVIRGAAGTPAGAICVTATGPARTVSVPSRPDGRYRLAGLRPGRYSLRIGRCASPVHPGGLEYIAASWPHLPAAVFVKAGQVGKLPAATVWHLIRPAPGARPLVQPPASARGTRGSISGVVTGHGHSLRDICAFAWGANGNPAGMAATSKTGSYRMAGLRPGRYLVEFLAGFKGCDPNANWLPQWYPYVTSLVVTGKVTSVHVRAGRDTPRINGKLKLGGEIAGTVRNKAGKPLAGICVPVSASIVGDIGLGIIGLATGKSGRYVLHGLFAGRYLVEFVTGCGNKGNYAFQWWRNATSAASASTIKIAGARIDDQINATLPPGATATGQVRAVNASGKPLAGICVSAQSTEDYNTYAFAETHASGRYRLDGLAAGRYDIQFDPTCGMGTPSKYVFTERPLALGTGQAVANFNAYLELTARLSGVVTDTQGHRLAGVCVQIMDDNNDSGQTGRDGHYSIAGVTPGAYAIEFLGGCGNRGSVAPQFYPGQPDSQAAPPVLLQSGRTTAVNAAMLPGGTVSGLITDAGGKPLSDECVEATAANETSLQGPSLAPFSQFAFTAHGHYQISNLAPGGYQLGLGGSFGLPLGCTGGRYAVQWFDRQQDPSVADFVSVAAGATVHVSVRLARSGGIAGTVTTPSGRPVANICVQLADARTQQLLPDAQVTAVTDGHGRYQVTGLTPGRYLVQFSDCNNFPAYGTVWHPRGTTPESAAPVTIRPGRTTAGVNGIMTIGGSISGFVRGPSGEPVRNECVQADDSGTHAQAFAFTNKAGHYRMTGLGSGSYRMTFSPCNPGSRGLPNFGQVSPARLVRVSAPRPDNNVNVRLALGGWVSGTVSGQSGSLARLANACVLTVPLDPAGTSTFALTDAQGRYQIPNLAAGKYLIYAGDPACDFADPGVAVLAPRWFDDQPTQATANSVTITAGRVTSGIDVTLQPYGSISGTVSSAGHERVGGECVTAFPFRARPDPFAGSAVSPEIAITSPTGSYVLLGLAPGRYKIEFSSGCGRTRFATQWWPGVVTVKFAPIGGINASLRRQ